MAFALLYTSLLSSGQTKTVGVSKCGEGIGYGLQIPGGQSALICGRISGDFTGLDIEYYQQCSSMAGCRTLN